ncbi:MAG: hypothetical protein K2H06_04710, partial [Anaeroplasmataceae bacterium]|nr:hypothetical protein [Anaeroplasmataceae bacterium]
YYKVESRLPLGRQANMHIYNNYYEECGTCQDIRANAFVFSEANYFYKCTTAQKVSTDSTYTGTIIKSFNDYYDGGSKYNSTQATKVNSRTQSLTGNCKPDGSTDYTNFDTNSTLFYYTGSASKVSVLHSNTDVPEFCKTNSGVLKGNITSSGTTTPEPTPSETWTNKLNETFSTAKPIQEIGVGVTIPSGISYCTDATDASQNNATIENGALHINDTSNKTTWGYYTFDEQNPTSGKVRVSVDFTIPVAGTKWTILTFRDGNGDIMIRTNDQGKLGYVVNGERDASNNLVVTPIESSSIVANTVYTVTLIVDYSAGTATIQINDTTVTLSNYTLFGSILGLTFMTAASATNRSFTVDNIIVDWSN